MRAARYWVMMALALTVAVALLTRQVPAKWVWREGRWVKVEDAEGARIPEGPREEGEEPEPIPESPPERPEEPEGPEEPEKPEAPEVPARPPEPEKIEKPPVPEKPEKSEGPEVPVRPPEPEKIEKLPEPVKPEKPGELQEPLVPKKIATPLGKPGRHPVLRPRVVKEMDFKSRRRAWPRRAAKTDEAVFVQAKGEYTDRYYGSAGRLFKRLIKRHPTSPHREEAMWLRGESLYRKRAYHAAFEQYDKFLDSYAGSEHFADALNRQFNIAEIYFGPTRRKIWGIPMFSGNDEAIEILRKVYERQPSGWLAGNALLRIGDYYYGQEFPVEAENYYEQYVKEFPEREHVKEAMIRSAQCAIEQCKGAVYDTMPLNVARDRLHRFQKTYPEEGKKEGIRLALASIRLVEAEKEYRIANYYRRAGHADAAAYYAERVMVEYGDTPWAERARQLIARMSEKGGRKK
ncbi:MAG: outer membrane protein assembly factor BamD [Phycisphaerae bacterium]|nr:outer membrane protein assembly factor BamD [Phycisphaerae bacterium]